MTAVIHGGRAIDASIRSGCLQASLPRLPMERIFDALPSGCEPAGDDWVDVGSEQHEGHRWATAASDHATIFTSIYRNGPPVAAFAVAQLDGDLISCDLPSHGVARNGSICQRSLRWHATPCLRGEVCLNTMLAPMRRDVVLSVNGEDRTVRIDTRMTLLDALRDLLGLTGSKKGCDHGQCGACTIHLNGERHLACLTLTAAVQGMKIETVEGLARGEALHPMQQAFIDHDAFQCGYCTSGQIMSAIACVKEGHADSDRDIREYMSGNLCRCAAYPNIVAAINQARAEMETA